MNTAKTKPAALGRLRTAFSGGTAEEIQLPAGTRLFKFSGYEAINPSGGVTPWWTEISELAKILQAAQANKRMLVQHVRETSAVLRQWNNLNSIMVIELTTNLIAYKGGIAPQNEAAAYMNKGSADYKKKFTKPVFFIGGNQQVFVKDISPADFKVIVPLNTINIYDDAGDIYNFLSSYHII